MTGDDDLGTTLRLWFGADANGSAPERLSAAAIAETHLRRQRPPWLARLLDEGTRRWLPSRSFTGVAVIAGLVLTASAVGLLTTGSSRETDAPIMAAPASLAVPATKCLAIAPPAPGPGLVPEVGHSPIEHPRNGLLAASDPFSESVALLDPETGESLATWSGVSAWYLGWSPDGRWLAVQSTKGKLGDYGSGCRDLHLISADGQDAIPITSYPIGDRTNDASWSPDGQWLAVTSWFTDEWPSSAIDVLRIAEDGTVSERRRIWASDTELAVHIEWGPDGRLAWYVQHASGDDHSVYMLGPDSTSPLTIPVDDVLYPIRWAAGGESIVAIGNSGLWDVSVEDLRARLLDLPVDPKRGIDWSDDPVAVATDGRVFFPAHDRTSVGPWAGLVSTRLDGRDVRDLTTLRSPNHSVYGPVLSPDQTLVAFRGGERSGGTWIVGTDGSGLRELSGSAWGQLAWQPVP